MSRISEIMREQRVSYTEAKRISEQEAQGSFASPSGYAAELKPTISLRELNNAVMNSCSCGGGGPDDKHTCPACMVYHRLVTLRHNKKIESDN